MDARVLELLNLELDGRLDDAGRAELELALKNSPVARTRPSCASRQSWRNPSPRFRTRKTLKAMDSVCDAIGGVVQR